MAGTRHDGDTPVDSVRRSVYLAAAPQPKNVWDRKGFTIDRLRKNLPADGFSLGPAVNS